MSAHADETVGAEQHTARELLARAYRARRGDAYCAKRAFPRYDLDTPLDARQFEARLPGDDAEHAWVVQLENMSASGIGIWSHRLLEAGDDVEIREWTPDGLGAWFSGTVVHVARGLRGYLIGVKLDEVIDFEPPDELDTLESDDESVSEPEPPTTITQTGAISTLSAVGLLTMAAVVAWTMLRTRI